MKLSALEPFFLRREIRPCTPEAREPNCSTVSPHTEHEYHLPVEDIDDADGVQFLCPTCFVANGRSDVGTHSVICWRPRVPADVSPKPGRWEFVGSGLSNLTLVAGSSSIFLQRGCGAHFFICNGEVSGA
jgi:hypothetical protein